ncbi:protein windpipe [Drosophila sulfurigaster albostrigata]|uniref:protein windpipe n=1 Tax=Drosophila sulfurigaster albostrigata TaxID=89887 RepID=UPI002D21B66F|nr:protein windpipe [Drosophila sulfurigaster albostrigata]XP_062127841.1 protein windpipe [Drosophila sulfurigaster albostrigata]XP_062127842.1 protein windpipe [Drosophila sulfurigaster albostrigata]
MKHSNLPALLALLLCICAATASTPATYFCPEDCSCTLSQHTHTPTLHAKCNSTRGLQYSEEPLPANIPIHSIDLSFLGLKRVGHILDMLPNLTSVDLSHNELHELGHLSKQIKKLHVKHNRLTSEQLLKLPQHLTVLNLQHNDITYLPMELTHLHHLEHLELGHNPINCSCSTLEVRNWLQERNMYMAKPVVCHQPREAYGKSWLQIKQSQICRKNYSWPDVDESDENELMMGDQPADNEEEVDELGKDFLVIDGKKSTRAVEPAPPVLNDFEGSGDLTQPNMEIVAAKQVSSESATEEEPKVEAVVDNLQQDEEDDGSGSGGGPLPIVPIVFTNNADNVDDFETPDSVESEQKHDENDDDNSKTNDETFDNKPVETPTTESPVVFHSNFNIFGDGKGAQQQPEQSVEEKSEEAKPVEEEVIVPVVQTKLDTDQTLDVITDAPLDSDKHSDDILAAKIGKKDDSNAIYFLLGVIALIVVGLILFVAIRRCKYNNNAAARDLEAQRVTELLDMDKKNLGKPLARNGHEQAPLIGEKSKLDDAQIVNGSGKKPYDSKDGAGQQPLLNGNGTANGESNKDVPTIQEPSTGEPAPHEYYPITPRYPTPQSPRASKYAQHPQGEGAEPNNNNEPDGAYLPSSPKSGRYSPVYSPETGRVKIKLTETPKPKTPMLVTRSKSNAGDIITTPVPTHQVPVGGSNGVASH